MRALQATYVADTSREGLRPWKNLWHSFRQRQYHYAEALVIHSCRIIRMHAVRNTTLSFTNRVSEESEYQRKPKEGQGEVERACHKNGGETRQFDGLATLLLGFCRLRAQHKGPERQLPSFSVYDHLDIGSRLLALRVNRKGCRTKRQE